MRSNVPFCQGDSGSLTLAAAFKDEDQRADARKNSALAQAAAGDIPGTCATRALLDPKDGRTIEIDSAIVAQASAVGSAATFAAYTMTDIPWKSLTFSRLVLMKRAN